MYKYILLLFSFLYKNEIILEIEENINNQIINQELIEYYEIYDYFFFNHKN